MTQLGWLTTGCSSGFGEELILNRIKHFKNAGAATMSLDVTDSQAELDAKVKQALKIYNSIDVLINNAGYIEAGSIEDITLVASCNTNQFGPVNLTRSILPHFHQRKAGTIIFMGSFGLEAVVECLQKETSQFVGTTFDPGVQTHADCFERHGKAVHGNQPGDPKKSAERIVDIVRREGLAIGKETPLRLPLGPDCLQQIKNKCLSTLKILEDWEELITSTKLDVRG
ncbi:uncharacterized protein EAF01_000295 [Botrytis porri]|uniref:uncharacterized protein n=1 Tax=Botrytis porri TaxID=87229 RepID=UPI0019000A17|nr:uncharacterized protein EAF01_000295 [Botrytis porri]KAF7913889.1 hypothetical protein EAF01_000295 [Botrytis porri]